MKAILAMALTFCLLLGSAAPGLALDPACGDGSVPKGVWPNCEPCAGAGAAAGVREKVQRLRDKLDDSVQPEGFDFVKNCIAGLEKIFFADIGLPSLEDLLGALCVATRVATQQAVDKLNQSMNVSYLGGSISSNVGVSGGNSAGGIKVRDTSAQARAAAAGMLRR